MSKHAAVKFRVELNDLFRRRSRWLNDALRGARPGRPAGLNRKILNQSIARMQKLASEALAPELARRSFQSGVRSRRSWHPKRGKGHGRAAKRAAFKSWFRSRFSTGTYVYVFWARKQCVYVGKTTKSGGRIASHFEKHWFSGVTRIDVYHTRGRRGLPALECLAIHRFRPLQNKFKAESRKWTSRCELCSVHRQIRHELDDIFRFRR
jgi:hypothetical protein